MTKRIKISKATVDRLPFAGKGNQVDYFDTELKGFGCRVSATAKTFFVLKRVNGKLTRVTLGRYGIKTAEQARKDAIDTLSDLGKGVDVNREKARAREKGITVSDVLDRYFIARQELKPGTVTTYRNLFRFYLADWLNRPIQDVTKEMVAERHLKIGRDAGKAAANNAMRTFRAIYNFANELLDDSLPVNPVKRLSNTRQWFVIERRQTVVHEFDLPRWFEAGNNLDNPIIRDYLLLLLFTGARRTEMACLRWQDVDMENKLFVLTKTKNGKPLPLPMSEYIHQLFVSRESLRENEFVFPGRGKKSRHLVEPRRQMAKVTQQTGIRFSVHDMRRTYTSAIDGIVGYYELKRLLNHSAKTDDVTAGYVVKNIEKLRPLMQKVTDHILTLVQPKEPGKILPLSRPAAD